MTNYSKVVVTMTRVFGSKFIVTVFGLCMFMVGYVFLYSKYYIISINVALNPTSK